jgi:PAS domain S-box-containing protein
MGEIDVRAGDTHTLDVLVARAVDAVLDSVVVAAPVYESGRIVDFVVTYANEPAVDVAGRRRDELEGRGFLYLWPKLAGNELLLAMIETARTGESFSVENFEYVDTFGGEVVREVVDIRASRLGTDLFVAWRFVTDRADAALELRLQREALEEAQRLAHLGTWFWDAASDGVEWSPEIYRIYGIPEGTPLHGRDVLIGLDDDCRPVVEETWAAAARGESIDFEHQIMRPDGTRRIIDIRAIPVLTRDRKLRGIRGTTRDVTELRTTQAALARERQAVEILQGSILQRELPEVEGLELAARYLPAASDVGVGGDWYDVFTLADGRVALSIGDVVGHGVRAAELMGQLRAALRMAVLSSCDPAAAMKQVDGLIAQTLPGAFATALAAIYDPRIGRFTWSRAGHVPPAVRRADRRVELHEAGGRCPLGVEWDRPAVNADLMLGPGDAVVLYTDGLVERRGERLDTGLDRLAAAVAAARPEAEELCTHLVRACFDTGAGADDVCVLTLVRTA